MKNHEAGTFGEKEKNFGTVHVIERHRVLPIFPMTSGTPFRSMVYYQQDVAGEVESLGEKAAQVVSAQSPMKLNSLIHQGATDLNRVDGNRTLLILQIELVSLRDLLCLYEGKMRKNSSLVISRTNQEQLYIQMDAIKLESVFG